MLAKALELRDMGTFIAILAVDMNPSDEAERYLLRRCGYPCDQEPNIIITRLDGNGKATNDPYEWDGRTYPVAHHWIIEHWNQLSNGDVVDVEFILGEKPTKKVSERFA